jgi:DNA-directed RNA polymerase specialized sigma24 family protein
MLQQPHALLQVAYRAALQVVHSPILAEEASERAIHELTVAILQGSPPHSPKAWLRTVARRSACAILRSEWARTKAMDLDHVADQPRTSAAPPAQRGWVREHLEAALTERQRDAFRAAISCNTTRAAARTCGMEPRDFRRSLSSISRRGRQLLDRHPLDCDLEPCPRPPSAR